MSAIHDRIMDNKIDTIDTLNKQKGFKLLHVNVRSLVKKMEQVKIMFHNSNMDVITLSETWLTEAVNSRTVELENYTLFRQDRDLKTV